MIAKLRACELALASRVGDIVIVDGRDGHAIEAALDGRHPDGATRLVSSIGSSAGVSAGI